MVSPETGKKRLLQIEVFPERLLTLETAQKLLNELNKINGIRRMVVYGPGLPKDNPEDLLQGNFVTHARYLNILGEQVELTVQVGRVWIELEDIGVKQQIQEACEKALSPLRFEINEGIFLRTRKTVTDYARKGGNVDDINLGLFDPKSRRTASCCGPKAGKHMDE
jgi:methyl-coenzyme M reductase subunit D